MSHLQQALANGYKPKGHSLTQTEWKILVQIDEVRSDAWTVSGLGKLPREWMAMRADVSVSQIGRSLSALTQAGVLEHDGGWIHINATGRTRRWATYRISPDIIGTKTEYGDAEIYNRTVLHGLKAHAGQMYRLRKKHPEWGMQEAWDDLIRDVSRPPHHAWCPICHNPRECRDCRRKR